MATASEMAFYIIEPDQIIIKLLVFRILFECNTVVLKGKMTNLLSVFFYIYKYNVLLLNKNTNNTSLSKVKYDEIIKNTYKILIIKIVYVLINNDNNYEINIPNGV